MINTLIVQRYYQQRNVFINISLSMVNPILCDPFVSPNGQSIEVLPLLLLLLHDLLYPLLQGNTQVVDFGVVGKKLRQHYQTIPNLKCEYVPIIHVYIMKISSLHETHGTVKPLVLLNKCIHILHEMEIQKNRENMAYWSTGVTNKKCTIFYACGPSNMIRNILKLDFCRFSLYLGSFRCLDLKIWQFSC